MALPAGQGLAVLHVLAEQWWHDRQLLAALGVEKTSPRDGTLAKPVGRAEQIERMGGEVMTR